MNSKMGETIDVRILQAINEPEARKFWPIYHQVFVPVNDQCPCRQSYTEEEFIKVALSPEYLIFVARRNEEVAGLAIATGNLSMIDWINPAYFWKQRSYNGKIIDFDHRVLYITCIATTSDNRDIGAGAELMKALHSYGLENNYVAVAFDYSITGNRKLPEYIALVTSSELIGDFHDGTLDHQGYCMLIDPSHPEFQS